jgi:hypothetical protein
MTAIPSCWMITYVQVFKTSLGTITRPPSQKDRSKAKYGCTHLEFQSYRSRGRRMASLKSAWANNGGISSLRRLYLKKINK